MTPPSTPYDICSGEKPHDGSSPCDSPSACDAYQKNEPMLGAEALEAQPQDFLRNSVDDCNIDVVPNFTVAEGRGTGVPVLESTPRISASNDMLRGDPGRQSYEHLRAFLQSNATACSVILRTVCFPIDQLVVLDILLPTLPTLISWDDVDRILASIRTEWCRVKALETLMSRLPTVLMGFGKDQVLRHFASSYYHNKVSSVLEDWLDSISPSAEGSSSSGS